MSRTLRRLVAGGVTIVLATVGLELVGTVAASAHANAVHGTVGCQADGAYMVTWQIANDYNLTEAVKAVGHTPGSASLAPSTISIGKNGSGTMTESNIPSTSTSASLSISGTWSDNYYQGDSGSVTLDGSCQPAHTPAVPTAADGSCGSGHSQLDATITIPSDSGVSYQLDGVTKDGGTYSVRAGSHTVTASSSTLTLNSPTSWTFDVSAAPSDCNDVVSPAAPSVDQSHCVSGSSAPTAPTLALASTTGVTYSVSPSGPYSGSQTVIVTATAGSGYEFTSPGSDGWTYVDSTHETRSVTFDATPNCQAAVSPEKPSVTQAECAAYGPPSGPTLAPATTAGITYTVSTAGPYAAGQTVTVTATAGSDDRFTAAPIGWTLVDSSHETYAVTFDAAPNCVAPENPTVTQSACPASGTAPIAPTLAFATTPDLTYAVSPSGPFTGGQTVTVTATAGAGTEFFTNAPSGWTYVDSMHESTQVTFDAATKCVEAIAPTFHDPTCTGPKTATNGTYTIPQVTGVEYLVNGVQTPAGNYTVAGGTTLVVAAVALPGYTLIDHTWTHTFPAADFTRCVDGIVAAQVSFKGTVCSANGDVLAGTYTVPDTTGVVYNIKGATVAAGTYAATTGSTVTITATAKTGFTLGGVTQWTHTFAAPAHCGLQVGGVQTPPDSTPVSSGTPANTGVPIGEILLTGIALILMGVACFAGTTIRRRRQPTT